MSLSTDLISEFVKATKDDKQPPQETTLYGTIVYDGKTYVRLDGSDLLTPVITTAGTSDGDRVTVLIKDHSAVVTGNVSSPAAAERDVIKIGSEISKFELIVADKVSADELAAELASIGTLIAEKAAIKDLEVASARIDTLEAVDVTITGKLEAAEAEIDNLKADKIDATIVEAKYATIESLEASNAKIHNLEVTYGAFENLSAEEIKAAIASIDKLGATYATIESLDATNARVVNLEANSITADSAIIKDLQADVANIDTLIFGSASGEVIQSSFANAVIAQLGNAQIKSAMIEDISASQIKAGDILTNNVRVMSEDGNLLISDETIQISDDARVRVQIGKDASGDYSINIWDAEGNLMFSEGGITDSAIKDAIIRDDMVAPGANINAGKLDISSLFTEINGSEETIKSNRILMDADSGTLDVAFTKMTSDISETKETVSSQGTALSVIEGKINSKVWQQDIETAIDPLENKTDTLTTQYSELNQEVDSISATVASHTTQISNKADNSTVTEVSEKVTELEASLDGFKSTVRDTYASKTELGVVDEKASDTQENVAALEERVTTAETAILQNSSEISLRATKTEVTEVSELAQDAKDTADGVREDLTNNYYTRTETDAQIQVSSEEIVQSVKSTYATKESVYDLEVGARNLLSFNEIVYSNTELLEGSTTEHLKLSSSGQYDGIEIPYTIFELESEYVISYDITLLSGDGTVGGHCGIASTAECYIDDVHTGYYANAVPLEQNQKAHINVYIVTKSSVPEATPNIFIQAQIGITEPITMEYLIENLKVERGNKPTDWTPAPEDVDKSILESGKSVLAECESRISATSDGILSSVSESYVHTDEYGTYKEYVESQLQQTKDLIEMTFSSSSSDSRIDQLEEYKTVLEKFIRFTGETAITIGSDTSDITLEIDNEKGIIFKKNGEEFGSWDGNDFHTGNIMVEVNERAQFGNFAFIPRPDGSLSFLKVGG